MADEADIVLVDWGTSSLRVWTLDRWGAIVGQRRSDRGMGRLSPADFGSELQANLTALDVDGDVPVLICGMAGAAQGWQEAQYIDLPSDLAVLAGVAVRVTGQPRDIRILPGMAQRDIACPVAADLAWAEIDDPAHLQRARETVYPEILRRSR